MESEVAPAQLPEGITSDEKGGDGGNEVVAAAATQYSASDQTTNRASASAAIPARGHATSANSPLPPAKSLASMLRKAEEEDDIALGRSSFIAPLNNDSDAVKERSAKNEFALRKRANSAFSPRDYRRLNENLSRKDCDQVGEEEGEEEEPVKAKSQRTNRSANFVVSADTRLKYGKTFTYKKSTHGNRKVRAGVARRRSVLDRMDMTEEEKALRDKFSFNAERQRLLEAFHAQSFGVKSVTDAFRRASDFVGFTSAGTFSSTRQSMPDRRAIEKARKAGFGGAVVPVGKGLEEGAEGAGKEEEREQESNAHKARKVATSKRQRPSTTGARVMTATTVTSMSPNLSAVADTIEKGQQQELMDLDIRRRGSVGRRSSITAMARRGVAAELTKGQEVHERALRERNRRRASVTLAMVEGDAGLAKLQTAANAMGVEAGRQRAQQLESNSSRQRRRLERSKSVVQMVTKAREILAGTSPEVASRELSALRKGSRISPVSGGDKKRMLSVVSSPGGGKPIQRISAARSTLRKTFSVNTISLSGSPKGLNRKKSSFLRRRSTVSSLLASSPEGGSPAVEVDSLALRARNRRRASVQAQIGEMEKKEKEQKQRGRRSSIADTAAAAVAAAAAAVAGGDGSGITVRGGGAAVAPGGDSSGSPSASLTRENTLNWGAQVSLKKKKDRSTSEKWSDGLGGDEVSSGFDGFWGRMRYNYYFYGGPVWIVLPDSYFRTSWDLLMLGLVLYFAVLVPLRIAEFAPVPSAPEFLFYFDEIANVMFWIDIFLNMITAIQLDGMLCVDRYRIAVEYGKFWLWIDLIASFPFDLIGQGGSDDGSGQVNKLLRLLRVFKLFRVLRLSRIMKRVQDQLGLDSTLERFLQSIFVLTMFWHCMACLYWFCSTFEGIGADNVYTADTGNQNEWNAPIELTGEIKPAGWVAPEGSISKSNTSSIVSINTTTFNTGDQYTSAFFFAVMATMGNGRDVKPNSSLEYLFSIFAIFIGLIASSTIVAGISTTMTTLDFTETKRRTKLLSVKEYLLTRQIPVRFQDRVKEYYQHMWDYQANLGQDPIFKDLHESLILELHTFLYKDLIENVDIFRLIKDNDCILELIEKLVPVLSVPNELIIREGSIGFEMYIIVSGTVEVYKTKRIKGTTQSRKIYLATLKSRDVCGERALLTREKRNASVQSIGYTDLLVLCKPDFDSVMLEYPELFTAIQRVAREKVFGWDRVRTVLNSTRYMRLMGIQVDYEKIFKTKRLSVSKQAEKVDRSELFGVSTDSPLEQSVQKRVTATAAGIGMGISALVGASLVPGSPGMAGKRVQKKESTIFINKVRQKRLTAMQQGNSSGRGSATNLQLKHNNSSGGAFEMETMESIHRWETGFMNGDSARSSSSHTEFLARSTREKKHRDRMIKDMRSDSHQKIHSVGSFQLAAERSTRERAVERSKRLSGTSSSTSSGRSQPLMRKEGSAGRARGRRSTARTKMRKVSSRADVMREGTGEMVKTGGGKSPTTDKKSPKAEEGARKIIRRTTGSEKLIESIAEKEKLGDGDNSDTGSFRSTVGLGSRREISELGKGAKPTTLRFKDSFAVTDWKMPQKVADTASSTSPQPEPPNRRISTLKWRSSFEKGSITDRLKQRRHSAGMITSFRESLEGGKASELVSPMPPDVAGKVPAFSAKSMAVGVTSVGMASGTSPSLASRRKSSLRFKSTFVKDGPSALAQKRGLILPNMVAMGGGEEEDIDDDDVIIDRGLVYEQRRRQSVELAKLANANADDELAALATLAGASAGKEKNVVDIGPRFERRGSISSRRRSISGSLAPGGSSTRIETSGGPPENRGRRHSVSSSSSGGRSSGRWRMRRGSAAEAAAR